MPPETPVPKPPSARSPSAKAVRPPRTPVRIYVLWHPKFPMGASLANDIYTWFRLENMEGIPVFFRSDPALPSDDGTEQRGVGQGGVEDQRPPAIRDDCDINYILPLVDANMLADPDWRHYLLEHYETAHVAGQATGTKTRPSSRKCVDVIFPVAMDSLAFKVPVQMRNLNFIRHDLTASPVPTTEDLLGTLTEVLCRDLRYRVDKQRSPTARATTSTAPVIRKPKIKIFLSHAKLDPQDVPRRLKDFIQSHTQCETFFDETDIPSGDDFASVLGDEITMESAGMIAIHGDSYAERPWCRREIRRFQKPVRKKPAKGCDSDVFIIPPVVVVDSMAGERITRSIPELGFAPMVRWVPGGERRIINTLLREILLGLFYRKLIHGYATRAGQGDVLINRAPDPVIAQNIINAARSETGSHGTEVRRILYPGYGLSRLDLASLEETFNEKPKFENVSVLVHGKGHQKDKRTGTALGAAQVDRGRAQKRARLSLSGHVVRLSIAPATDIRRGGLGDQHNLELLVRVFRTLATEGVSLLYAGEMPKAAGRLSTGNPPDFTTACLHLILSERVEVTHGSDGTGADTPAVPCPSPTGFYSLVSWPDSAKIEASVRAQWAGVCSFHSIEAEHLDEPEQAAKDDHHNVRRPVPVPGAFAIDPADFDTNLERRNARACHEEQVRAAEAQRRIITACCLSKVRRVACGPIDFLNMDLDRERVRRTSTITAISHVFVGGRLRDAAGVAPGIFEEFLYAVRAERPIFLIGAGYGAAGAIARWLLKASTITNDSPADAIQPPPEFHKDRCVVSEDSQALHKLLDEWRSEHRLPKDQLLFDDVIQGLANIAQDVANRSRTQSRGRSNILGPVFRNGLTDQDNRTLLRPETGYGTLCELVRKGLETLAKKGTPR